jgi:O-acetyl-ADP-ribose deacetylase (regulator of RNase III)
MINYAKGDILRDESEALVNTVNCVGVMGRGIALQFRNEFPDNFTAYAKACQREEVQPGRLFVYETDQFTPRYIINFPTKRHWRGKSRLEDIESGLRALVDFIRKSGIRSIAIPPLGSGLGGLEWIDVKKRIESALVDLEDVQITVYEPTGAPSTERMVHNREVPKMTAGRAALIELIHQYLGGLLDPVVSLLEVHKLMYLMQEVGEPLRLRYKHAYYGPFAENLGHVLKAVEGHLISGYADGGDAPDKPLKLVPGAYDEAQRFLDTKQKTREHAARVSRLVRGFESPVGLELLATVHWIEKKESAQSVSDLVKRMHAWSERKSRFTPRQIKLAAERLEQSGLGSLPPEALEVAAV